MSLPIPIGKSLRKIFGIREGSINEEKMIPLQCHSENIFLDAYYKVSNEILRRAQKQLGLPREEVILRKLIPQDLGLKQPLSSFNLKKGLNKKVIETTSEKRFMAINGFTIPKNCSISQIQIWRAGEKIRHWHIEGFEGTYFFDDPFLIDMNQLLQIDMYSEIKKKQKLIFHGSVTEERGTTINP